MEIMQIKQPILLCHYFFITIITIINNTLLITEILNVLIHVPVDRVYELNSAHLHDKIMHSKWTITNAKLISYYEFN